MYDQRLMDRCIQSALKNPIQSRGRNTISRMAALITDTWVEYYGENQYKTHPLMKRFSKSDDKIFLHAEIDALISLIQNESHYYYPTEEFPKFDIYIARVLKDGTPALAKPCYTCFGALTYFGIRNIYWTKS